MCKAMTEIGQPKNPLPNRQLVLKLPIGRSVQEVFRNLSNLVARVSYVGQYGTTVVKNCLQLSLARQKYTQLYFNNFELSFQIAEGDVCRGLRIPIYMIFPRLFTCPTLTTANFKIGQLSTYNKNHKRRQDFTESQSKASFFYFPLSQITTFCLQTEG